MTVRLGCGPRFVDLDAYTDVLILVEDGPSWGPDDLDAFDQWNNVSRGSFSEGSDKLAMQNIWS